MCFVENYNDFWLYSASTFPRHKSLNFQFLSSVSVTFRYYFRKKCFFFPKNLAYKFYAKQHSIKFFKSLQTPCTKYTVSNSYKDLYLWISRGDVLSVSVSYTKYGNTTVTVIQNIGNIYILHV